MNHAYRRSFFFSFGGGGFADDFLACASGIAFIAIGSPRQDSSRPGKWVASSTPLQATRLSDAALEAMTVECAILVIPATDELMCKDRTTILSMLTSNSPCIRLLRTWDGLTNCCPDCGYS